MNTLLDHIPSEKVTEIEHVADTIKETLREISSRILDTCGIYIV